MAKRKNEAEEPQGAGIHAALQKALAEMLVLYFLCQKPMYTYELIRQIRRHSDGVFAYNTLYIAIYRLQERGLIREDRKVVTEDNRTRVYFALTEAGRAWLARQRAEYRQTIDAMERLLARDGRLLDGEAEQDG